MRYQYWCISCIGKADPRVMSGYCIVGECVKCSHCNHLAMVDTKPQPLPYGLDMLPEGKQEW